jgi:hypothetical protein
MFGAGRGDLRLRGNDMGQHMYTVSELCENGEMFDFVYAAGGLPEPLARLAFK